MLLLLIAPTMRAVLVTARARLLNHFDSRQAGSSLSPNPCKIWRMDKIAVLIRLSGRGKPCGESFADRES